MFKKGDKIKCIHDIVQGSTRFYAGEEYIVTSDGLIGTFCINSSIDYTSYFELVRRELYNFGIKVVNQNGKSILEWFKKQGYTSRFAGDAGDGSVYFVSNRELKLSCIYGNKVSPHIVIHYLVDGVPVPNKNKIIIGYKPNGTVPVETMIAFSNSFKTSIHLGLGEDGLFFSNVENNPNHIGVSEFRKAGVLDLWLTPVYKDDVKSILLSNGKWVEVKNNKAMGDGYGFTREHLLAIRERFVMNINNLQIVAQTMDIGCWKNITNDDLELVLKYLKGYDKTI